MSQFDVMIKSSLLQKPIRISMMKSLINQSVQFEIILGQLLRILLMYRYYWGNVLASGVFWLSLPASSVEAKIFQMVSGVIRLEASMWTHMFPQPCVVGTHMFPFHYSVLEQSNLLFPSGFKIHGVNVILIRMSKFYIFPFLIRRSLHFFVVRNQTRSMKL